MKGKMTPTARAELADAIRGRYVAASAKEKGGILEEFIAVTGYHEKSAIRVLNTTPTAKRRQTRQRQSLYDDAVRTALIVLWRRRTEYVVSGSRHCFPSYCPRWSTMDI